MRIVPVLRLTESIKQHFIPHLYTVCDTNQSHCVTEGCPVECWTIPWAAHYKTQLDAKLHKTVCRWAAQRHKIVWLQTVVSSLRSGAWEPALDWHPQSSNIWKICCVTLLSDVLLNRFRQQYICPGLRKSCCSISPDRRIPWRLVLVSEPQLVMLLLISKALHM